MYIKIAGGLVWIATREGLNVYDTRRHMFLDLFPVVEAKGNFIAAITEDQERNMWVSTSRKVIRVTVASDGKGSYLFDSRAYNSEDGLQNCDFNQRSIKNVTQWNHCDWWPVWSQYFCSGSYTL